MHVEQQAASTADPSPDAARPPVHRRRGAALLDAIHRATLDELAEVGFEAMTIEAVAARAGAGKASLYKRWATKEELVLAALAATDTSFEAEAEHWRTVTPFDLRTALVEVLLLFASGLDTPQGRALHVLMAWRERHPRLDERVREVMVRPRQEVLHTVLDRAVAEGSIPASAVTPWTIGTGPRLVIAQHRDQGRLTREDAAAIVDQILVPALLHPPAAPADPATSVSSATEEPA